MQYRPDIDGLRALAIIIVVLYHAEIGFSGGYIGVDVFFVISGFLITSIIQKGVDERTFSITAFWCRRIRRIVPASMIVLASVLGIGFFMLLPGDFNDLLKSSFSHIFATSNIYFWRTSDYFNPIAETKPLLHTWSLAIEEQYYFVLPFLIILLQNFDKRMKVAILALIAAGSFILCEIGSHYKPTATFFLLPTRAWEMLIGSLLVYAPIDKLRDFNGRGIISLLSLATILICSITYTKETRFPGIFALPICAATAAIISTSGSHNSLTRKILTSPLLVGIGLISYSLYLIHWPILAIGRYWIGGMPYWFSLPAVVLSLILAYFSWKHIETPFRKGRSFTHKSVFCSYALLMSLVLLFGTFTYGRSWFSIMLPKAQNPWLYEYRPHAAYQTTPRFLVEQGALSLKNQRKAGETLDWLILGDSHAMVTSQAFLNLVGTCENDVAVMALSATAPLSDVGHIGKYGDKLANWERIWKDQIDSRKVKNVLLVGYWTAYLKSNGLNKVIDKTANTDDSSNPQSTVFEHGLRKTIYWLNERDISVFLLQQIPEQKRDNLRLFYAICKISGQPIPFGITKDQYATDLAHANEVFTRLGNDSKINFKLIDVSSVFDSAGQMRIGDKNGPYYMDSNHLSPHGARTLLAPLLSKYIETE